MNTKNILLTVGLLGLVWNIFGTYQFIGSVNATSESLIAMGMSEAQANVMTQYPLWMTIAFAIGVFGGLIGSILLLLKKAISEKIFLASLLGYIILYIGDITEGIFEAIGKSQVIILTTVVAIAFGLWFFARAYRKKGLLN
jgi:Co/Zn/Cd efflux system component